MYATHKNKVSIHSTTSNKRGLIKEKKTRRIFRVTEAIVVLLAVIMSIKAEESAPLESPALKDYNPLYLPVVPVCSTNVYTDPLCREKKKIALESIVYNTPQVSSTSFYMKVQP